MQNKSIGTVGEAICDINEQVRAFAADKLAQARRAGRARGEDGGEEARAQGGAREALARAAPKKRAVKAAPAKAAPAKAAPEAAPAKKRAAGGGAREAARREGVRHGDPSGEAQGGSRRARGVCRRASVPWLHASASPGR